LASAFALRSVQYDSVAHVSFPDRITKSFLFPF
jgi:hypothetical protein